MDFKSKKIAVISHDAGGAEIISSFVRKNNLVCFYVLSGPAVKIFEDKLGVLTHKELNVAIDQADLILCGTSWKSKIEIEAIIKARTLKKYSIVFLDHWVNYQERFIFNNMLVLPDEIFVFDEFALKIAQELFHGVKFRLIENPYFLDIKNQLLNLTIPLASQNDKFCNILYVCEPIREHALRVYGNEMYWGYNEDDALIFFLKQTNVLSNKPIHITIRPHPSEEEEKYDWVKSLLPSVIISRKEPLINQIINSSLIAGCSSMAMVIGLLANKRVVSVIPPEGRSSGLPHKNIEKLSELILKKENLHG